MSSEFRLPNHALQTLCKFEYSIFIITFWPIGVLIVKRVLWFYLTTKWNTMFHFFIAENSGSISEMGFIIVRGFVMTKILYLMPHTVL